MPMRGRIALAVAAALLVHPAASVAESSPTLTGSAAPRPVAPTQRVPASLPSDRVLGRADAPVTIIEYASFTCSHCATFSTQVLPELKKRYIDTGKAKLVFRDLPTPPVQVASALVAMGRCAAPDRFFDYADYLMQGQEAAFRSSDVNGWIRGAIPVTGRTEAELLACMQTDTMRTSIEGDIQSAQAAGVTGTPTLFVNGQRVPAPNLEGMVAAIEPLVR